MVGLVSSLSGTVRCRASNMRRASIVIKPLNIQRRIFGSSSVEKCASSQVVKVPERPMTKAGRQPAGWRRLYRHQAISRLGTIMTSAVPCASGCSMPKPSTSKGIAMMPPPIPNSPPKKPRAAPSVRVNTSSLSERKGMCRGQQEKTHDIEIPHSYNGLSIT